MKMPSTSCCVYGCLNTTVTAGHLTFFTLPSNKERRTMWLQLVGREELLDKDPHNYTVCSVHFRSQDITQGRVRTMLRKNVVPTLLLPPTSADLVREILKKSSPMEFDPQKLPRLAPKVSAPQIMTLQVLAPQQMTPQPLPPKQLPTPQTPQHRIVKKSKRRIDYITEKVTQTNMIYVSSQECQTDTSFDWMPLRERQYAADPTDPTDPTDPADLLSDIDIKKEDGTDDADEMQTFHNLCDRFLTRDLADLAKLQAALKWKNKIKYRK